MFVVRSSIGREPPMPSKLPALSSVALAIAAAPVLAHPGHGAPPSHLHGELIFVGLFLGVLALGWVLHFIDPRRGRFGHGRAKS
jgi:hypothetical protein